MVQGLGPCIQVGDQEEAPSSVLISVIILGMNPCLPKTLTYKIKKKFFLIKCTIIRIVTGLCYHPHKHVLEHTQKSSSESIMSHPSSPALHPTHRLLSPWNALFWLGHSCHPQPQPRAWGFQGLPRCSKSQSCLPFSGNNIHWEALVG